MRKTQPQKPINPRRTVQKYFVSAFVVFSFTAYTIHERMSNADPVASPITSANNQSQIGRSNPAPAPTATSASAKSPSNRAPAPTATAVPAEVSTGMYKDGEYVGPETDAYFGMVQVKVSVQSGKIANVQFLDFPHDRRTSQRINQFATPLLVREAIQTQNAQVDIVSGATLTSEAFIESLQTALNDART